MQMTHSHEIQQKQHFLRNHFVSNLLVLLPCVGTKSVRKIHRTLCGVNLTYTEQQKKNCLTV